MTKAPSTTATGTWRAAVECGFVIADPRDPDIIYLDSENGIQRFNLHTFQADDLRLAGQMHRPPGVGTRTPFNWTSPLMMSPSIPTRRRCGTAVQDDDDGKS